jgi:hypothetical protein
MIPAWDKNMREAILDQTQSPEPRSVRRPEGWDRDALAACLLQQPTVEGITLLENTFLSFQPKSLVLFFESMSPCVAQADLKFVIL